VSAQPPARFRGLDDVRMIGRQLRYEQLNFWLNPVAAAFTVVFSVVFLVLLASSAGNSHSSTLGGGRLLQYYVPGFVAYGIMATAFNTLAVALVVRRETGLLKRMRLAPLPTWVLLSAIFASTVVIAGVQVVLVLLIGRFGYHVRLPQDWAAFTVALVVGTASFTALGAATSTLVPNQEAGGPVVAVVFFILLFLSGLWYPINPHSALAHFSSVFPVRHMILAVYAPFSFVPGTSSWAWRDDLVMVAWGCVGAAVTLRRWSWAPRRSEGGRRRLVGRPGS
jgi:ABC-2 type transport system permease protein